MKATKISLEKLVNLGNYESVKLGVEIELEAKDTVDAAFGVANKALEIEAGKLVQESRTIPRTERGARK